MRASKKRMKEFVRILESLNKSTGWEWSFDSVQYFVSEIWEDPKNRITCNLEKFQGDDCVVRWRAEVSFFNSCDIPDSDVYIRVGAVSTSMLAAVWIASRGLRKLAVDWNIPELDLPDE